ncbi:hypothetical protein O6H91_02G115700 [Diphasiastrum complanatum]|uniref:Uncharacterized protein n=3 Tax=Diphasiastrum complanatum TaxID=34168 RepID=A0ACC2EJL9_DIPCM|nr:hypothetical protein O6H91_02G115700 [Diphasiastrum complanatum]KAJ7566716.1 hypothetical protein O6H91_02G115700 [Diphasiastrum complanatum]KAJ7566717.1 hypothetical protein O6H91_02G115700 [Diphasiastrum complanatum]
MAPSLRKALGAVKDQTSIGLAKVASTSAPDLDVAMVKATSHDDMAVDEKYVLQILQLTSISRSYSNACLLALAKRLGKTHNWIVAVKVLVLIHRLLRDGNAMFKEELSTVSRRILNLSNFRDESHSNAWDYSTFVRTYAAYLDARMECFIFGGEGRGDKRSRDDNYMSGNAYENSSFNDFKSRFSDDGHEDDGRRDSEPKQKHTTSVKDMEPQVVLEKVPSLQHILERVLACRPTGAAKNHRLIHIALYTIVKESFQIYEALGDGFSVLLNAYFSMKQEDCVKMLDIYVRFGKQSDALSSFYDVSKAIGVCRESDYPRIEKISEDLLDSLEKHLNDRSRSPSHHERPKTPEAPRQLKREPISESKEPEVDHNTYESIYGMRALPAPPTDQPPTIPRPSVSKATKAPIANGQSSATVTMNRSSSQDNQNDLLDLNEDTYSAEDQQNKFALALFSSATNGNWETFDSDEQETSKKVTTWQASPDTGTSENGKAGWELALVSEASNFTKVGSSLAGKFDKLLLDSMYDHAASQGTKASLPSGSSSSVALPGKPPASVLALPAPVAIEGEDPFTASTFVPPPSYVQMADLKQKQLLLLQEQQLWQQYQQNGMHGQMSFYTAPYAATAYAAQNPFGLPYVGMGASAQGR